MVSRPMEEIPGQPPTEGGTTPPTEALPVMGGGLPEGIPPELAGILGGGI